jgi:outer membrane protein TolC
MRPPLLVVLAVLAGPSALSAQAPSGHRLTLGDAARLAADRATRVLEARAQAEAADARVETATSALLPRLDADLYRGARTFNTASFGLDFPTLPGQTPLFDPDGEVIGPVNSTDVRARAEIPLLDLGAWGRRRGAQASAAAAHRGEEAAADQAAAAAAYAYVATLRARGEVGAREDDLALAQELLTVAHGLLESGVGVAIDVTRAEAQVATIRVQLLAAQHEARTTELALRRSLRIEDDARLELIDELQSVAMVGPLAEEEAVAVALVHRKDLETAEAYEAAAEQAVSATRAARLPRLSASVDEGFYGRHFDNVLNTYTWTLRLSVPLFDGFERSAREREQRAAAREIGYHIDGLRKDVVFQVRAALLDLESTLEQAGAAEERERLAQLEVDQEEERVRAGVAGTADLVRAAMRLNDARTARLDALAAVHSARVGLAAAMGTVSELP